MLTDSCSKAKNSRQTVGDACLLRSDLFVFYKMISVFHELVLSMVRNAVFVLPNSKNRVAPNSKMHEIINKQDFSYKQSIATRDIFLFCLPKQSRKFYDRLIQNIVVKNSKIAITIDKTEIMKFNEKQRVKILKNLSLFVKIMNKTNNDFQRKLPEAKLQGKALIKSIKPRGQIPEKAKCKQFKIAK